MRWFWAHYLPSPAAGANEYASPLRAEDLRDLPPGLILTAEFDTVRDEAESLWAASGSRRACRWRCAASPGMVHGFLDMAPVVLEAREGLVEMASWLRLAFYPVATAASAEEQTTIGRAGTTLGASEETTENELVGNASLREDATRGSGAPAVPQPSASAAEALASTPGAPLESGVPVRVGMQVVGADGHVMGKVKAVRDSDFVVDRRFRRDIALPFEAVYEAGDRVILSVSAKEATRMDWSQLQG